MSSMGLAYRGPHADKARGLAPVRGKVALQPTLKIIEGIRDRGVTLFNGGTTGWKSVADSVTVPPPSGPTGVPPTPPGSGSP